jgi:hypothetical protein
MKYQLVLQFRGSSLDDYEELVELENSILECLGEVGYVDGHDGGGGEMNMFIHTNDPKQAFDKVRQFLETRCLMSRMKVAFREFGSESYTILHPHKEKHFSIG